MRLRSVLAALVVLSACAEGEPIGEPGDALALGQAPPEMASEVFVEVAGEDGRPIPADAVWIAVAPGEHAPARCMESECDTWIADVVTDDHVTAYAEVCGFLYLEPLEMSGAAAVHVTVTADDSPCAPEREP